MGIEKQITIYLSINNKKIMMTLMAVVFASAANAQYNTSYYNQYGGSIGSSTTRSEYGGGYTTNYHARYGGSTGSATTRSNYGGGKTTNYYDQYGGSTGSATTQSNYGGGYTTHYYDQMVVVLAAQ